MDTDRKECDLGILGRDEFEMKILASLKTYL